MGTEENFTSDFFPANGADCQKAASRRSSRRYISTEESATQEFRSLRILECAEDWSFSGPLYCHLFVAGLGQRLLINVRSSAELLAIEPTETMQDRPLGELEATYECLALEQQSTVAEPVRFELTEDSHPRWFSRPVP
jgi:hypothetical protein